MASNGEESPMAPASPPAAPATPAPPAENQNIVRRKLTGYVGFANLPNQWHRKSVRKGFNFNVMVVGKLMNSSSSHHILDVPSDMRL
jgi:septin 7